MITLQILKRQINSWACLLIFFQKNFLSDKIPISSYQASQIYLKNELICQILRDNLIYPRKAVFEDSKNQEFTQREIFSWKDTWFRRENNFSFEFNYNFIIHSKERTLSLMKILLSGKIPFLDPTNDQQAVLNSINLS